jgi:hypothetical protein
VDSLLRAESKRSLANNEDVVKNYLREALLVREFGQDNEILYREKLSDDQQLQAALSLLGNGEHYSALLQPANEAKAEASVENSGKKTGTSKKKTEKKDN